MNKSICTNLIVVLTLLGFLITPVLAEEESTTKEEEMAKIAEAMNNPLSYLWMIFTQNDYTRYDGDLLDALGQDEMYNNTFLFQPVLSIQLNEEWKSILRPVFQINSFETLGSVDITTGTTGPAITGVDVDREFGLGDTVLLNVFSDHYTPPFVYGFGYTAMFPTATEDQLGTGKYSVGPAALALSITDKWILGCIAQHWWSYGGDDWMTVDTSSGSVHVDRSDVNLTDFQYILRYRVSPTTNIGCAPNIQYNWETDELSLPIGIGGDMMIKLGKLPVKIGAEFHYYLQQDDAFGPEWKIRTFFVPVVPSPEWSRKPLF